MFHYVTDKEYLRQTYSLCADLVNQLVQKLRREEIEAEMAVVGSKKRGMITQNENAPIDYDFNLFIHNADSYREDALKNDIRNSFNYVLSRNGWGDCCDSTSVLTTEQRVLTRGNKTPFSIDIAIIKEDRYGNHYRLIHRKTGFTAYDQWYWNQIPCSQNLSKKEDYLKPEYWHLVRDTYLDKKNIYLRRNDHNHPSFVCYIEAVNEVYECVRKENL